MRKGGRGAYQGLTTSLHILPEAQEFRVRDFIKPEIEPIGEIAPGASPWLTTAFKLVHIDFVNARARRGNDAGWVGRIDFGMCGSGSDGR